MAATSWFRRNQKKLLGLLVVFLMVIWGIGPAAIPDTKACSREYPWSKNNTRGV